MAKRSEPWHFSRAEWVARAKKQGKRTQTTAQAVVMAPVGDYAAVIVNGTEHIVDLRNAAWVRPAHHYPGGITRPSWSYAVAVLRGSKGTMRVLAYHEGVRRISERDVTGDAISSAAPVGGMFARGDTVLDAYINPDLRGDRARDAHGVSLASVLGAVAAEHGVTKIAGPFSAEALGAMARREHRTSVVDAIRRGEHVADNVTADYPDLVGRSALRNRRR